MKTLTALALFLATAPFSFSEPVFLGSYSDAKGKTLQWIAETEEIARTQSWDGTGACPSDITRLVSIAFAHIKQRSPESHKIEVNAINLQRADRIGRIGTLKGKWFLTVSFGGITGDFPSHVRLLMNGRIIPPTEKSKEAEPAAGATGGPAAQP